MTSKQPALRLALTDDLRAWIETQAQDIGCDAATWIRMQLVAARKAASGAIPPVATFTRDIGLPRPEPRQADPDAWRGSIEDDPTMATEAIEAIGGAVERALAEAENSGATLPTPEPVEMFARTPAGASPSNGATRALSVPPRRYSGNNNPPGL